MKILSAIVSKNAPVLEDTFHFLANRPSKKSVQADIKATIAGINIKPSSVPSSNNKYKIAIIGATGAIGREIVSAAIKSDQIEVMTLLVRRKLPEWEEFEKNNDHENKI